MYNLNKFQLIFNKSHSSLLIFSLVGPFKNFISPPFFQGGGGDKFSGNMVEELCRSQNLQEQKSTQLQQQQLQELATQVL
jgi:hypothetical protein